MSGIAIEFPETNAAPLSALILAGKEQSMLLKKVLESLGFSVTMTTEAPRAEKLCARQRFDLGIYDQDVTGALDFAGAEDRPSKPRIAVGLIRTEKGIQACNTRLHFVLHKPFTSDLFARTVKACLGPINAERSLSFRHSVDLDASECYVLHGNVLRAINAVKLVNVSHTGLCLHAAEMLPQGATVEVTFVPAKDETPIKVIGTVVWAHASGRAGLKFSELDPAQRLEPEGSHHSEFPSVPLAP
jgi:CheY-like chemotaxis protein